MSSARWFFDGRSAPPFPTRDDACRIQTHFQGLEIWSPTYSPAYGEFVNGPGAPPLPLPWFPAAMISLEADFDTVLEQLVAAGDRHAMIDLNWDYGEPGQPYGTGQVVPPRDLTDDLPTYFRLCDRIIEAGLLPIYTLPADGQSGGGGSQGPHSGYQFVYDFFPTFVAAMGDRIRRGPVLLGFDGTWPASWSVDQVKAMLRRCREVGGPELMLALMFANGPGGSPYLFVQSESDYVQDWMQCLDIVLTSTTPDQAECPAFVNYAQYMLGPALVPQGVCTPEWAGPFLLGPQTPRGPFFWGVIEDLEYQFVRRWVSVADVDWARARMQACGMTVWG